MSGLLALLDDVAAIAKVAAASVDDIAASTVKASSKSMALLIDDAAVTPKYVVGLSAARELPIIGKIALGSLRNKLLFLLPALMLLTYFSPWAITPILMMGGAYLCYEGAEKVLHWLRPGAHGKVAEDMSVGDPTQLEEKRVQGAVKTDFILSAEIMTLSLSVIETSTVIMTAITLAAVGIFVTMLVYGVVALLVKMDDIGLHLAHAGSQLRRKIGRSIVFAMPGVFTLLTVVGTAAMCWVGGEIITHGLDVLGAPGIYGTIHYLADAAAHAIPAAAGFTSWFVTAALNGVLGLALGLLLVPVVLYGLKPILGSKLEKH